VRYRCLLLFFICFVPIDPFLHILIAIGFVIRLCYYVGSLLGVVFDLCLSLRI
jgi:hypothetical protein